MIAPDTVHELVTEYATDLVIRPEAVVLVRYQAQFDSLSGMYIKAKQFTMLVRCKLSEEANRELMGQHDMVDCRVGRESP
jgi:hypothetical protein